MAFWSPQEAEHAMTSHTHSQHTLSKLEPEAASPTWSRLCTQHTAHTAFSDGSLKTVPLRRVVEANAFNHSIQEAEADESLRDRGQPCLQSEFPGSQDYTEKPYLKQNKPKINKKPTTNQLTKQTTTNTKPVPLCLLPLPLLNAVLKLTVEEREGQEKKTQELASLVGTRAAGYQLQQPQIYMQQSQARKMQFI